MALVYYSEAKYLPSTNDASYALSKFGYKNVPFIRETAPVTAYHKQEAYSDFVRHYGTYGRGIQHTSAWAYAQSAIGITSNPATDAVRARVYSIARSRLTDKWMGDAAQWGATVAEGRQAFSMIANRLGTIYQAYRALRKGDLKAFSKKLSVKVKRKHKRMTFWAVAREASSLWLEYWFGWSPLLAEIHTSLDVLEKPWDKDRNGLKFHASAKESFELIQLSGLVSGNHLHQRSVHTVRCKVGVTVECTNYNALLTNRMGLVNPLTVAWELVPFSFVADWFFNLHQVIGQYTEFVGVSVSNPWHIYSDTVTDVSYSYRSGTSFWIEHRNGEVFGLHRKPGLPSITLASKSVRGLSKTRAATASSLVVAIFSPKK